MNHGSIYRDRVDAAGAGTSLFAYLARRFPHSDAATWTQRIIDGEVAVDDAPAKPGTAVRAGQEIVWTRPPWTEPEVSLDVRVIFDDDALFVVDKPAGLPTLPGAGFVDNTLLAWVRSRHPSASPMHRLGRGTSGLVLFVKTPDAARAVEQQWSARTVEKTYRALVAGVVTGDAHVIETPIGLVPDAIVGELYAANVTGKRARSVLHVVERRDGCTLVDVDIETGRPHQIRIHAAALGHPLVDDPLYGPGGVRRTGSDARPGDVGYALHAYRLRLRHPTTHDALILEALPPPLLTPA